MTSTVELGRSRIAPLDQPGRFVALGLNLIFGWGLFVASTGLMFPMGSGASIWFLAMCAHWILTLVAAPYFLPPKDSFGTAVSVILLLVPLNLSAVPDTVAGIRWFADGAIVLALLTGLTALIAVIRKDAPKSKAGPIAFRLSDMLGRGEVLLTPAVIVSVIGFYSDRPEWMAALLGVWTLVAVVRPVELLVRLAIFLIKDRPAAPQIDIVGRVSRVDDPDIIRVTLDERTTKWDQSVVHIAHLANGQARHVLPLFTQVQNDELVGTGLCCTIDGEPIESEAPNGSVYAAHQSVAGKLKKQLSGSDQDQVAGITVEGSTIGTIRFQVLRDCQIEEGSVVFADCRGQRVFYQVLDGSTAEESFERNPFGAHIAAAIQLGCYDKENGFVKFAWLPSMNQPLFMSAKLALEQTVADDEVVVGEIPSTKVGVTANMTDLIEHHAAILGITGTGKTELVFDLVTKALATGAKVFCVDFTGEYKVRLGRHTPATIGLDATDAANFEKNLFAVETGTYGAPNEKKALKIFIDSVRAKVTEQVKGFLEGTDNLGLLDLGEITNSKATLKTTELYLSSIMEWAKKNKRAKRILIVLEEAHTIIPETFGAGFDSDTQWVVSRIGQIGLQGRKYGVGLLLVSQRTALVSKTILSQCNTYFTYALVDKTSLEYLSSVYGPEHVRVVPNLRPLELLAYGKGIRSERPILVRRVFDQAKFDASRKGDAVSPGQPEAAAQSAAVPPGPPAEAN